MNVTTCEPLSYDAATGDMPEASRQPAREVCKPGAHFPESTAVPNVLLIGDSVASGYESFVRDELMGVAQVQLSPWLFSNNPVDGAGEPGYFAMCAQPSSQAAFSCSFACGGAAHSSAQHGWWVCSAAGALTTPMLFSAHADEVIRRHNVRLARAAQAWPGRPLHLPSAPFISLLLA